MVLSASSDLLEHKIGGTNFGFSAARIENLGATEYTLATLFVDVSGSVQNYKDQLEKCIKAVIQSCRHNPRADNMMLRLVFFDDQVAEFHGFKPLPDCNETDYDGCVKIGGMTALFDAVYSGVKAMLQYGSDLAKKEFDVNAAIFVLTDGFDNRSKVSANMVADAIEDLLQSEQIESLMSILIGVNVNPSTDTNQELEKFHREAKFQKYIAVEKADEKALAKIAEYVSQSLSSQSQHLKSGGPSQALPF